MVSNRIRAAFAACSFAATLAMPVVTYAGQEVTARRLVERRQEPAAAPAQPPASAGLTQSANETRAQLYRVLEKYPPALGRVLRLDPTLMTNQAYLSSYPQLASFVAQYPDIPRNPGYYLERYGDSGYYLSQPRDARQEAIAMWRNLLEFMGAFLVFSVGAIGLIAIIRYVVEYRRWHRISKVNAEVHNKILDRFGSNEELLAYIDSPAGRRFLEATPIAPSAVTQGRVAAPYGRILLSVQIGVLLLALSLGFMWVSSRAIEEVQEVFMGLSIVGMTLGLGCIVSAVASYALSRRLGLLQDRAERPAATL